ncbi:uncharacterized protein LOC112502156 [Cynara cardunculus var. scolymus]|uniref:Uncharacterized protein n=1 Tax=Cynara cardunculus var. scolymus TaxID=59895 RepID=A0A103XCW5_CYNCS|nr:uncharacterized protein LOC112502156 [Cynara cardunculus var. scolymus]KVH88400.1 hypothetical protein Ccrd_023905 [Cynara cardunculus var. scolymus]
MYTPPPLIIIFTAVTLFATVRSNPHFLRLPSDDVYLCPDTLTPGSCPVKCFRTAPVCGVNNVTYWCGCAEALCAGTRVAKLGFCNGGSGPVSGQALLLVHILWLILLGFFVLFGLL